jgi:dipeptidyl-peptidase-4
MLSRSQASRLCGLACLLWALCNRVHSEEPKPDLSLLTLDRIFDSEDFRSDEAPAIQWCKRRGGYTSLEKPALKGAGQDLVWHDVASDEKEILVPAHRFIPQDSESPLSIESYAFSDDESKLLIFTNSKRVWRTRSRGDYWVLDIAAGELKRLGGDAPSSTLMFATFSPDGSRVAFVRQNNLYVQDVRDLRITPLTSDGSSQVINGTFDWVYEEELGLRNGFRWSPDGKYLAYWQVNTEGVRDFLLINNTNGLYSQVQAIPYPKAGDTNSSVRVGVVRAEGGATNWLSVPGDPREHYIAHMDWAGNSNQLLLQQFNRLQNLNRLLLADVPSGEIRTVHAENDEAWVENSNTHPYWFDDHQKLVWLSERDGWQHAYAVSRTGGQPSLLTAGQFDVISVESVDAAGGWLYYIASPDNPTQRYLFRVRLDGTQSERLTPESQPGTHSYNISPDAKWAVHTYSNFDTPHAVDLISLPDHKSVRVLAENKKLRETLGKLKQPTSEFFRVSIGDSVLLDGWCIRPPALDSTKRYPVLFYVYGEPAGQTVLDQWGGRRHLWNLMLAQQGYIVISVDNRGTPAPRGRAWRKCVYRQIGILAPEDQAAAARTILKERPYIDPQRVAIWGWSGGGSMTLNAIFRYPDLYRAGMSVAPVPNQRFYDSIYQERYMGLPADNADGYRRGSAIHYAHQLKGHLLLVHGTGDDNVHYQGSEALINELIAHNKSFSMFAYPNRSHSISERKNTTRHLFGLLTRFLNEKISPGPQDAK